MGMSEHEFGQEGFCEHLEPPFFFIYLLFFWGGAPQHPALLLPLLQLRPREQEEEEEEARAGSSPAPCSCPGRPEGSAAPRPSPFPGFAAGPGAVSQPLPRFRNQGSAAPGLAPTFSTGALVLRACPGGRPRATRTGGGGGNRARAEPRARPGTPGRAPRPPLLTQRARSALRARPRGATARSRARATPSLPLLLLLLLLLSSSSSSPPARRPAAGGRSPAARPAMPEKRPFERLPADVCPLNYGLCLKPDLIDFTFEGKLEAAVQVRPGRARTTP
uniref:Uncharacterized protein n=1 Tax=Anas platyrhynchos platyrhynchos TaxID=8840 RepID=A0A493TFW8_ANAPP